VADLREQLERGLTDHYRIERELGRGGMAVVYLAQDLRHDRPVALKVLLPELAATLGPERFQREIRLAARLQHPHILTVHDSGEAGGRLWFTMPFVEGESLRDRLGRERQLPVEDALRIAREAAAALDYAHRHGVVHRDIKPENILLTADGDTLVADFGIARALGGEDGLTQTGMAIGTPAYMSPEQASGDKAIDARTDIYSLGAVLYEMLAGEAPYTGPTPQAIIMKRLAEPVPSARKLRPNVPDGVDQAIRRALAPIAADRFASAGELGRALHAPGMTSAATPSAITPGPPSAPPGTTVRFPIDGGGRRRMPVLGITLALGFLLGLGVLFAWRHSHPTESGPTGARVLAVLPFENVGDSANAYLADGISNELRGKLSQLASVQVIASGSSNQYRRTSKAPQEIARELGADYLLTATVQWERLPNGGSRVRVSPELVDVTAGHAPRTKWQQPFDASITDVFQVQADIAGQVASALDVELGARQKETLIERPTQNLAAYDAFLKGEATQGLILRDPPTLRRAITYYEQAVALDSTFAQAWAHLARAHATYYFTGTPNPTDAEAARRAADRAVALAPDRPESQWALGAYYAWVLADYDRALAAYESGLKIAPDNADLLTAAALAERSLGRWDAAEKHLERAWMLDPRSATTAQWLSLTLLWLRRYPDALTAVNRGLAVAPADLGLIRNRAMVYLAQGHLVGARVAIRAAPAEVEPTALVAYFGNYWDLPWALDDDQQQLLLRLPPSAYDGDRGVWGIVRAQTCYLRGDRARARVYADSARLGFEETLKATPDDPQRLVFLGLALAYLGQKEQAIKAGERAVALDPVSRDGLRGPYMQHQLARIYIVAGEPGKALDQLEPLLKIPYFLSPGWLRIDPNFTPLKGNPRFERLVDGEA
jgi:serine/threonine protein kinase/TolB-like protein/cytochrome c-type biogenesis protein CcmH/NrfG